MPSILNEWSWKEEPESLRREENLTYIVRIRPEMMNGRVGASKEVPVTEALFRLMRGSRVSRI